MPACLLRNNLSRLNLVQDVENASRQSNISATASAVHRPNGKYFRAPRRHRDKLSLED